MKPGVITPTCSSPPFGSLPPCVRLELSPDYEIFIIEGGAWSQEQLFCYVGPSWIPEKAVLLQEAWEEENGVRH